jgi:hypothetical protein
MKAKNYEKISHRNQPFQQELRPRRYILNLVNRPKSRVLEAGGSIRQEYYTKVPNHVHTDTSLCPRDCEKH